MSNPEKFWMVYGLVKCSPSIKHVKETAAEDEARRLAAKHPGTEFYVLQAVSRAVKQEVRFERVGWSVGF